VKPRRHDLGYKIQTEAVENGTNVVPRDLLLTVVQSRGYNEISEDLF
jgi:hypothetical protein